MLLIGGALAIFAPCYTAAAPRILTMAGSGSDVGQLDPHVSASSQDKILFSMMFNGLVRFAPGTVDLQRIEPDLASSWQRSSDGLRWRFALRTGVKFHHGYGELTAADVVASLERAANPAVSSFAGDFASIASVRALGRYEIEVVLREPVPDFLGLLTNYHGGNIVSARAVSDTGAAFRSRPIGTGPFAFERHLPKRFVALAAHADYFRGRPQLDEIRFRFVSSDTTRELAFMNGEIDLFMGKREGRWIRRVSRRSDLALDVFEPGELRTLFLNTATPPLNDVRVRRAIAHAIDRDELVRFVGTEVARAAWSPVPSGYAGHSVSIERYAYDPGRARALLAESGHAAGLTIKTIVSKIPAFLNPVLVLQEQLRRVGIRLDVEVVEHSAFHAEIRKDNSPLTYYGAARFPVADSYLTPFYHSRSTVGTPTAALNFSHCAAADAAIDGARTATDAVPRLALWRDAQDQIMKSVCGIPLFELRQVWARKLTVHYGHELKGSLSTGPVIDEMTAVDRSAGLAR